MVKQLEGKVALVTGASKGLGASIAQALAAEGARVVVNYAGSKDAAEQVVRDIEAAGGTAIAVQANVSRSEDTIRLAEAASDAFGKIDILVNNAGIYEYGSLAQVTPEAFHKIFDIDVLGLLLVTKETVARMNDGGSIVNIGSLASSVNPPGTLLYAAAKHAADGITTVLSSELAVRGIRVNSVNPGLIETEGTRAAGFFAGTLVEGYAGTASLGIAGRPQDIASIVTFLAGPEAAWINGQVIVANGVQN